MKRILNLQPSPIDVRDYPLGSFLGSDQELPVSYSSDFDIPITDQLSSDMCLAFQAALLSTYQNKLPMSPGWLYYFAHILDPRENVGGLYPVYAFKAMQKMGMAKKEDFNRIGTFDHVKEGMTKEVYEKIIEYSKEYGIKNWVRLTTKQDMQRAIYENGYIIAAIPVYKEFFDAGSFVGKPNLDDQMYGGHAIGFKGYNEKGFETVNSWGKDWGEGGKTTLGYDYPIWEAYIAFDKEPDYPEDIIGHWNEDLLKKAYKKNLLKGYPDGLLKPDREVTRAEIISILDTVGLL